MSWLKKLKLKLSKIHRHSYPSPQRNVRPHCLTCGLGASIYKSHDRWVVYGGTITSIAGNYKGSTDPQSQWLLASPFSLVGGGRNSYPSVLSFDGKRVTHTHRDRVKRKGCIACNTYLGERGLKDYPKNS